MELRIDQLPSPGLYEIIFITQDPILDGCTVEKRVPLLVNELPLLVATQTTPATDCATADGSFEITMQASASTVTVQETGEIFTNVNQGDVLSIANVLPGVYTIEAENSTGCSFISTVTVENSNPPAGFQYTITTQDETCSASGIVDGNLTINFATAQSGSYLITRQGNGLTFSGNFTNSTTLSIQVPFGDYAVEVTDITNCSIPDASIYSIVEKNEVVFSVPSTLNACGSFTFRPDSPTTLNYILTDQSGNVVAPDSNGDFTIIQSGDYLIIGEDPAGIDCPRTETITANITQPLEFEVSPPIIDCQVGVQYEALLTNAVPADVVFLWRDAGGIIVGRSQVFVPNFAGSYTLEVQPRAGGLCPTNQKSFDAILLTENLDVALDIVPFCIDQTSTTITVEADLSLVQTIEWYSVQGGTRTRIPAFDNLPIIEVTQEGIYEVLLRSAAGCDIGRADGVVTKSTIIPPVLPQSITICAVEGVTESINPGSYDNYSWKLNGNEISTSAIFTPTLPGIYELTVSDNVGCIFIDEFEVIEDCALKVSFPNAVVLNDPNRNFILYANEYIDVVETLIFNRWGELIFYCEHINLEPRQAFCAWDGKIEGNFVPNGTYAVVVKFTSNNQNKTESITKAITIIQ